MSFLKNKLFSTFGIYTLSNVFNAGIPFLLLPILTKYLSPSDYGVLSNFNGLVTVLVPFVGFNLMAAVSRQYIKDDIDRPRYISTGLTLLVVLTILFSFLIFFFRENVKELTGIPEVYVAFTALYASFTNLLELILAIWRMENKPIYYGVLRLGKTLLEISIAITLIAGFQMAFEGSIHAMFFAMGAAALVSLLILYNKQLLSRSFSKSYLKHIVNYGAPLIPHALSGVIILYSDKLIITHYLGLSATGVYSVGFLVGQLIGLLQNSFNQAWVPWVFTQLKENNFLSKIKIVKITYLYFIGILLLTVAMWFVAPYLYFFVGKGFHEGIYLVFWIALGFAFNGMYKMVAVYIFYSEKTKYLAVLSLLVAGLNISLNFAWIPIYGEVGAALATVISFFVHFLLTWALSSKLISMPWSLKK